MGRWQPKGLTEGFSTLAMSHKRFGNILRRFQHVTGRYSQDFKPKFPQESVAAFVLLVPAAHVMCDAINFDAEPCFGAIEVDRDLLVK